MRQTLLGLALLTACGTDIQALPPDATATAKLTWFQDVAPVVSKHCMSCHQDGGIAPFALTAYEDARDNAQRMLVQIDKGAMPPYGALEEPDCTPRFGWVDDPRLSATEKKLLHDWVDQGAAKGIEAPVPQPPSTALSGITKTVTPTTGFAAKGDRDEFVCYVLDPQAANGAWITGLQVRPGIPDVVHHVVLTEIFAGTTQDQLVAAHPVGQPFDCSTIQQPGDLVVNIWTPGNQPMETPNDLAVPLLANAKLVMQIHYHPAGIAHAPDVTSVDLRTSLAWPKKMYFVGAFGNAIAAPQLLPDPDDRTSTPEFRIPANKADHTEHMRFTVGDLGNLTNVRLYSANPHMHLIGTHISGSIERPAPRGGDPQKECLANGNWNFDWQRTYIYNAPLDQLPSVQQGDIIDIQCKWDNTLENPFVQRALADQGLNAPIDIALGEGGSTDEMCLEIFGIAVDAPPPPAAMRVDQSLIPSKLVEAIR
ncbi:MAG: cytochrome c [Deltaproteobacteria bacterium]|nr:cytochrome c [Deltaproteobacteria bacterium]